MDTKLFTGDEDLSGYTGDIEYVEVTVPELKKDGVPVTFRFGSLSAEDMIQWIEANDGPGKRIAGINLLVKSMVNAEGNRIGSPKLVEFFKNRSSKLVNKLVGDVIKLNGLNKKDQIEERKNESSEASIAASPTV